MAKEKSTKKPRIAMMRGADCKKKQLLATGWQSDVKGLDVVSNLTRGCAVYIEVRKPSWDRGLATY